KVLINEYHLSQVAVAEHLGTTQAAISYYISSKRGNKKVAQFEEVPMMKSMAMEVAKGMASGKLSPADTLLYFCKMCRAFRVHNIVCILHKDLVVLPNECDVCPKLETLQEVQI
ncbi:MAG: hypothetical protein H3Z51_03040, partial [archaeon]|nr:hypothetical protein [archaeon]